MNLVRQLIEADRKSLRKILIVGDPMLDVYVHGHMCSTCQEECPKFVEEDRRVVLGGAANAARSLVYWRTTVVFPPTRIVGFASIPTKTRFMIRDKCVFRYDNDQAMDPFEMEAIRTESLIHIPDVDAVLLSDYDKGIMTPEFIRDAIAICKQYSIPCVADCKRAPETYEGCILKGNVEWLNRHKPNLMTPQMVVTNGWDAPTANGRSVPTQHSTVSCINHVGAGDCFAAHMTLALAHGFSLSDAAAIAHSAGRVYVQHRHNRPPRPKEIVADMDPSSDVVVLE